MFAETIKLPANLAMAQLIDALYPEARFEGTLVETRRALGRLVVEWHMLKRGSAPGVTEHALNRQQEALWTALKHLHANASKLYFATPGWTQHYLKHAAPGPGVMYFFASRLSPDETAQEFEMYFCGPNLGDRKPRARGYSHYLALRVANDDEVVHLSKSPIGLSHFEHGAQYSGPASGLMCWAIENQVMVKRVVLDVKSN